MGSREVGPEWVWSSPAPPDLFRALRVPVQAAGPVPSFFFLLCVMGLKLPMATGVCLATQHLMENSRHVQMTGSTAWYNLAGVIRFMSCLEQGQSRNE